MFKKDFPEKSRSLLQKKESKKLKVSILSQFSSMCEAEVENLLGGKSSNITEIKLNNRILVYCIDSIPYFFECDSVAGIGGNNENTTAAAKIITRLYPTIFALWRFPHVVTSFIIHAPVSSFILKGADLMMPGLATVTNLTNNVKVGDIVAIRAYGNPLPFAVGESLVSWEGIEVNGRRGRGVKVIHNYTDCLYQQAKHVIGNAGFGGTAVYPIEGFVETRQYSYFNMHEEEEEEEDIGAGSGDPIPTPDTTTANDASDDRERQEEEEQEDIVENETPAAATIYRDSNTAGETDAILLNGLLVALKYVVNDKQLPVLASAFWAIVSKCIAVCNDNNIINFDVKSSSYKKVGPFLQKMETKGLLKLETVNGITSIVSVQRIHDLYRGVSVPDPERFRAAVSSDDGRVQSQSGGVSSKAVKITVADLYKLPKHIVKIFGNLRGQFGGYLKATEIRDALVAYFRSNDLDNLSDKSCISVASSDPLYKIAKKCPSATVTLSDASSRRVTPTLENNATNCTVDEENFEDNDNYDDNYDDDYDGNDNYEDDDDNDVDSGSGNVQSDVSPEGVMVAGVWMHTVRKVVTGSGIGEGERGSGNTVKSTAALTWKPIDLAKVVAADSDAAIASGGVFNNTVSKKKLAKIERRKLEEDLNSNVVYIATTRKDEMFKTFLRELSPYAAVVLPNGNVSVTAGEAPKIDIVVESRMGHKTVTRIRGLESFGIDLAGFTKECQKKFACSASVSTVAGMLKEKEINIQGHLSFETEGLLIDSIGVPKYCINVVIQKNVKSKKK